MRVSFYHKQYWQFPKSSVGSGLFDFHKVIVTGCKTSFQKAELEDYKNF